MIKPEIIVREHTYRPGEQTIDIGFPGHHLVCIVPRTEKGIEYVRILHSNDVEIQLVDVTNNTRNIRIVDGKILELKT